MNTNTPDNQAPPAPGGLTAEDFLALGAETSAFVKAIEVDGKPAYGIFSAFGQPLGYAESFAVAQVTVRQNDLEPFSVH
ncbi:MAG TPA: hypothetical protein DC046_12595 [Rhodospirillaceae bacterium]|nr:hypothetical protein [Rhodospirillaceae bacterium]